MKVIKYLLTQFFLEKVVFKLPYKQASKILKLRDLVFELVNRTGLKPFLYRNIPKRFKGILLKKHLKYLSKFPIVFSIEITNICNARCWFCPVHSSKRKKGYMNFDLYKKIMDEINHYSWRVKSIALFMDGEPTLHKGLVDYLKYARKLDIENLYISSNMEFFTPELTNKILNENLGNTLQYIMCSLDGQNEETYRNNRIGVNFKKAVKNTEYLIRQRNERKLLYPRIFTRLLISDLTKDEVDEFNDYWKGKADKVLCYKMHNWGGQVKDKRMLINNINNTFVPCYFPFSQCAIQYDGRVRLCCVDAYSSIILGNVRKESIKNIWNSKIVKKLRNFHLNKDLHKLPKICNECSYPRKGTWIAPYYWER